jgi:tRNA-2-methylthio-N6-dimethylallyladenosine synthase
VAKKLFIKSYGCQMNVYDAERMMDVLKPLDYVVTDNADDADLVILNTCHIRERAAEKVYSELGRWNQIKKKRDPEADQMILAVGGCVAQAEGEEIVRRAPYVDMVFGPQTYHRLPEMIAQAHRQSGVVLNTDFPPESKFDYLPKQSAPAGYSAFLTVQEGCDKFCAFCVVPYTRGAEFSRPAKQVMDEAKCLVAGGVKELTLLGQNVNNYHGRAEGGDEIVSEWGLGRLINELSEIDGLTGIRYVTSYPADMDDDLINAHRDVDKLMPYLHLPAQSGSDRILKAMNRRHTSQDYLDVVARLREIQPNMAFSSDFIVGFPGETEEEFEATMELVRTVEFVQAYSFKYSPRPGTPAAANVLQVPEKTKSERLTRLQNLLNTQQLAFNQGCVGKRIDVLLEQPGRYEGQLVGRSPYMQSVHVDAPTEMIGEVVTLVITGAHGNSLSAELLSTPPAQGQTEKRAMA